MRKAFPTFLALLAVGAGGAAVYLYQRPIARGSVQPAVAGYLPADTLLLAAIADPQQTAADWKTTDIYKLWMEPEVQAFLEKPLSKVPPNAEFDATVARIQKLEPRNLFIALASIEEKTNEPHLLAGFRFKGSNTDVEHLLAGPKDQLRKSFPAGKADLISYEGRAIETFDTGDGTVLSAVFLDDWYLLSNNLALLKASVDRFDHRAPASQPTLEKEADFQAVCAKLAPSPETLIFARPQPLLTRLFALVAASGQPINAEQRAEVEKIKAVGATTAIENGNIHDTIYDLAPGLRLDFAKLTMGSLSLTSPETVFYLGAMLRIPDHFDVPAQTAPGGGPGGLAFLQGFAQAFTARGLSLPEFRAAFQDELGVHINWPAASQQPGLIASLDVRDKAAAEKFVGQLTGTPIGGTSWQHSQNNGATYHTLATAELSFLSPTLTLTDKHLILGLNPADVRTAAARESSAAATLAQGEVYKAAAASVVKPNAAFAYLDTRTAFERIYGIVQPMALMGAAFLLPQANDYVDLGKLPKGEVIARHLSPIIFSEAADAQGVLIESIGPMTFGQAGFIVVAGSAAAAVPLLQKQFAGLDLFPGAPAASPDPAGTPLPGMRRVPGSQLVKPPATPPAVPASPAPANGH